MRFKVGRDVLAEAVQWSSQAVPQRPAVPVLAGVKLSAAEGVVELSSFDYEVSARSSIEADVETPGEVLVSGRLLAEISRALPNRDVIFSLEGNQLRIHCGNSEFALATMSIDDYPTIPALPPEQGTADSQELAQAFQQVGVAASKEEALPLLTGVRIMIEGSKITLLATDRYRLAMRVLEWNPQNPDFAATLLVKAKVLADVSKTLASAGEVELSLSEDSETARGSMIGLRAGGREATSVLMDGDYPPVLSLFPDDTPLTYTCNRQELLEAVRRVSLVAERKSSVRLTFTEGALTLEAGQGDNASAQESVQVFTSSEEIQTAFNPQFLQEGLATCEAEYVQFGFTHPTKAAVLVGLSEIGEAPEEKFKYLLMPIRFGA